MASQKDAVPIGARVGGVWPKAATPFFDEAHAGYFCWKLNQVCTRLVLRANAAPLSFSLLLSGNKRSKNASAAHKIWLKNCALQEGNKLGCASNRISFFPAFATFFLRQFLWVPHRPTAGWSLGC